MEHGTVEKSHVFIKAHNFIGQNGPYFRERNLHITSYIHTVGKIIYSSDKIMLKSLSDDKEIPLHFLNNRVPEDGIYVHVYGSLSFFKDLEHCRWFNFDDERYINEDICTILDITCWTNLQNVELANEMETILYKINNI